MMQILYFYVFYGVSEIASCTYCISCRLYVRIEASSQGLKSCFLWSVILVYGNNDSGFSDEDEHHEEGGSAIKSALCLLWAA